MVERREGGFYTEATPVKVNKKRKLLVIVLVGVFGEVESESEIVFK